MAGRRALVAALLATALGGCGFQPLYGKTSGSSDTAAELRSVAITSVLEPAQPRTAQLVRNALLDRLNPSGPPGHPTYGLSVDLTETKGLLAITQAEQVTRTNLSILANYRLTDAKTGKLLHQGLARATTAYNVLRIDYGNVVVEKDARRRLAAEIAERIRSELGVWLAREGAPLK